MFKKKKGYAFQHVVEEGPVGGEDLTPSEATTVEVIQRLS